MARTIVSPNAISDWLNKPIINTQYVLIDRWSPFHFLIGIIVYWTLTKLEYSLPEKILYGLTLLVVWEILEVVFAGVLFSKDTKINIVWDVIIGGIGLGVGYLILR